LYNTLHDAHFYHDFVELDTEINFQGRNGHTIAGVQAYFAAHPPAKKGKVCGLGNRLYVLLEFMQNAGGTLQKFNIDTSNRTYQIPDPPPSSGCPVPALVNGRKPKGGNNNGQLCPPACNP
jgi:hypothetical protein